MAAPTIAPEETHSASFSAQVFTVSKKYKFIKPIGTGAYGYVVSALNTETGQKVAIKKIPDAFRDLIDAKRILREIKLMRHFKHENCVSIVDLQMPKSRNFSDIYIITELMETDLHRIVYSRQKLSDDHIQYFVYQILRALKYVHSANVLHRDLKPSNILLNSNCDLKICDFGLARGVEDEPMGPLTEYVVTRWYRAPEIMLACKEYTKAVDVWSVGCILAELLNPKPLFPGEDYLGQLRLITDKLGSPPMSDLGFVTARKAREFMMEQSGKPGVPLRRLFPKASPKALDLLSKMLEFSPEKRITIDEALKHPYMASLHSADDEPVASSKFNFDFEKLDLTKKALQDLIYDEIVDLKKEQASDSTAVFFTRADGKSLPDVSSKK